MEGMSIHCMGVMERSSLESRESDPLGTLDWVVHSFLVILNSLLLYVLSFTSTGVEVAVVRGSVSSGVSGRCFDTNPVNRHRVLQAF